MTVEGVHIGVEFGGTKVVVGSSAVGEPQRLLSRQTIATTSPDETLGAVVRAMPVAVSGQGLASVGIGSFGPLDLRQDSTTYGAMLATPKPGWSGVDVFGPISERATALGCGSVSIDTDVAAALLGERMHGAAVDEPNAMYMTVGTGIGAAFSSNGPVRGSNHSEAGHVWVPAHPDDSYGGRCPYHGACLEGMASGPTIVDRFGDRLDHLVGDHAEIALNLVAWYVGHGLASLITALPVSLVIIGGGVSQAPGFHQAVVEAVSEAANGYPPVPFATDELRIVSPALGDDAGVVGAIEVGRLGALDLDGQ